MPSFGAGGSGSGAAERLRLAPCLASAAPGQTGRSPRSAAAGGPGWGVGASAAEQSRGKSWKGQMKMGD